MSFKPTAAPLCPFTTTNRPFCLNTMKLNAVTVAALAGVASGGPVLLEERQMVSTTDAARKDQRKLRDMNRVEAEEAPPAELAPTSLP